MGNWERLPAILYYARDTITEISSLITQRLAYLKQYNELTLINRTYLLGGVVALVWPSKLDPFGREWL